jgi:purine-binding chemotaxis protein CheW
MEIIKSSNSYLTFKIGGEVFAANVTKVLSILELEPITKVPLSPDYLLGVINLRGSILPIIDGKIKFGMQIQENVKNPFIVVMEVNIDGETIQIGVLVDSVSEVIEVEEQNILPPPSIGSKYKADFIQVFSPL